MNGLTDDKALNICVLGNSHVGSLKFGWDLIKPDYAKINITFFAARADRMRYLSIEKGVLIPTTPYLKKSITQTSGGFETINLSAFDVCLIYGLKFSFPYKLEFDRTSHYFSKAVYEHSILDTLSDTLSMQTLKKVRSLSDMPVYIGHNPLTAYSKNPFLGKKINYSEFVSCVNRILIADKATLLAQPEETLIENIYTKTEYKSGAIGMDVGDGSANKPYADKDNLHMNGEFGRIYLESFFKQIPRVVG
ncbi:MAG: hypothetical protein PHR16_10830 [Methylovulum sp.]|nr:hypothetical protein [Methylovulum sp.]